MRAKLCLSLTSDCNVRLELLEDELEKLDQYIMYNFENSDSVRKTYKDKVEQFLNDNKDLREKSKIENNGKIVLLCVDNEGEILIDENRYPIQLKVYYKKDRALHTKKYLAKNVKEELLGNKKLFTKMTKKYPRAFSGYEIDQAKKEFKYFSKSRYEGLVSSRITSFKKSTNGYYYLRSINRIIEKEQEELIEKYKNEIFSKPQQPTGISFKGGKINAYMGEIKSTVKKEYFETVKNDPEELNALYDLDEIRRKR